MVRMNAPQLADMAVPENWFMWQAFQHLRGARGFNGPIPFGEIAKYSEWAGITCPIQRTRLMNIVMALDNAERTHGAAT